MTTEAPPATLTEPEREAIREDPVLSIADVIEYRTEEAADD